MNIKKTMGYPLTVLVLLLAGSLNCMAQTDTINFSSKKLLTRQLKTGLKQYLVYFQNPGQPKKLNLSLWTREVKLIDRNGEKCFNVIQKWYGNDTTGYRSIYSINRGADFAPLYHSETTGASRKAFNWYPDHINGADTIADNKQKTFAIRLDQPCFNWNLDMETYEMLPLAAGKKFVIRLYDAGFGVPDDITFKVIGDEVLRTMDNQQVGCWKLFTESDHDKVHYTQTYWISKKGHEFLMEEDSVNGMYRYKVKMPGYAPDIIKRFK